MILNLMVFLLRVAFIINQMDVIDQDSTQIFLEFEFQVWVVVVFSCNLSKWIACDVYHINALCESQEPEAMLLFNHVE